MLICKVYVRHLPHTMNPGKLAAQVHHAGVQMLAKYSPDDRIKEYLNSICPASNTSGDGFGTTIVLEAINKFNTEGQIRNLIEHARQVKLLADVVVDPSYPLEDGLWLPALTCGWVLADKDHTFFKVTDGNWKLHD